MLLKGKTFTSKAFAIPLLASFCLAPTLSFANESVEQLRQRCVELRDNEQTRQPSLRVLCAGYETTWLEDTSARSLANDQTIRANASTKGGRFQTEESMFNAQLPSDSVTCRGYVKEETRSPAGLEVVLSRCEELTPDNLREVCSNRVKTHCADNLVRAGAASQSGMCVVTPVQRVSTCEAYN